MLAFASLAVCIQGDCRYVKELMVLTDEKAEVVAKAAMIFCQTDVDAWIRSSMEIASAQDGQPSNPQAQHEAIEKSALDVITAYVVKARGELIRKNINPIAPPAPSPSPDTKQAPPA
jgi:phage terminase Nu1 subunit (DNA packaging protein)